MSIPSISKFVPTYCELRKLEGDLVDTYKRQAPEQLPNWSEQCLTCQHFKKTSHKTRWPIH